MKFGLTEQVYEMIRDALGWCEYVKKVYIFGSRARGDYRENSDIDLAVEFVGGDDSAAYLARLMTQLDDLPLLYKFDVVDLRHVQDAEFLKNMSAEMVEFI